MPDQETTEPRDPLAHVKVGDPNPPQPDEPRCTAYTPDCECTRDKGHPGQHIAAGIATVLAVWPDNEGTGPAAAPERVPAGRRRRGRTPATAAEQIQDAWDGLTHGTKVAQVIAQERWLVVAWLLKAGAVESWAQVGEAVGLTETQAHDGFCQWLDHRRVGDELFAADLERLLNLAEEVGL